MAEKPATNKTNKNTSSFEETLWDSANKLRGSVESSEYKHIVLSLIFLKFISDKFEARRQALIDDDKTPFIDMVAFYTQDNVFYLPEQARWDWVLKHAKQDDIALKIDTALHTVEKTNKSLAGALPDNYFSRLGLEPSKLAALLDTINNINTLANECHMSEEDLVGRVYEYFLGKFAATEGKGGGEFYTPKSIVALLAEMLEPYKGKIYDPCCGSGGINGYHNESLVNGPGIIVGRKGTVGSLYWESQDFFPIDTVFYVKPFDGISLEYCFLLLQTLGLKDMNTDAAVPGLNRNNAYRLEFALPVKNVLSQFTLIAKSFREKLDRNNFQISCLVSLRDTLLPKLISGELRIPEAQAQLEAMLG